RLRADAREARELVDQVLDRALVHLGAVLGRGRGAELGRETRARLLLRQRLVLDGLGRTGYRVADHAGDRRRDPEQILQRLPELLLEVYDLLDHAPGVWAGKP